MMLKRGERANHPMFVKLPVFESPQFKEFKDKMELALSNEQTPFAAHIENVFPGLQQWQNATHSSVKAVDTKIDRMDIKIEDLKTAVEDFGRSNQVNEGALKRDLAKSLLSCAQELLRSSEGMSAVQALATPPSPNPHSPSSPPNPHRLPLTSTASPQHRQQRFAWTRTTVHSCN